MTQLALLLHLMIDRSSRRRHGLWLALAVAAVALVNPARALVIDATFDSSITNDASASVIEATINQTIQLYQSVIANPITVNITFQEMGTGLGQSNTFFIGVNYTDYLSALAAHAHSANDATALAHLPGTTNNPVDGQATLSVTTALAKALALGISPGDPALDSTISLNTSLMNLNRTGINPAKYDLQTVVSHEIDEALGTSSGLGTGAINPVDLFRYTLAGARTFTTAGDNAYFSLNGTTQLAQYNQDASGDYGDWWSINGGQTPRVQDAFATPGATPSLGVELTALDVIGFDVAATIPEPANTALVLAGFATLCLGGRKLARRRSQLAG